MSNSNLKLSLCRTCLAKVSQTNVFNIFQTMDLAKKLMLCSGLLVETEDEYPDNVCFQCYEKILLFYEFQQMCSKSLDAFSELLKTKEKLEQENEMENCQVGEVDNDPLHGDINLVNHLREKQVNPSNNKNTLTTYFEKKAVKFKKLEEKSVTDMPARDAEIKSNHTSTLKDGLTKNFDENSRFDKASRAGVDTNNCFVKQEEVDKESETNDLEIHNCSSQETNCSCRFCTSRAGSYTCRYCEQTFTKARTRKFHEMRHTGEKPHKCEECGRRFVQPTGLRTHRKMHLRQKKQWEENRKRMMDILTEEVQNTREDASEAMILESL